MKTFRSTILIILLAAITSCNHSGKNDKVMVKINTEEVYVREPNDSSDYKRIKYDFYSGKGGQLFERKLVFAKGTNCNCLFEIYYDSVLKIYTGDTLIEKPLKTVIDINSFVWLDSAEYSKDRNKVYYFHGNSDGGNRVIVDKADPTTFTRLCEYRWGIDKNHVFYKGDIVKRLDLKSLQVLKPPDSSDHFIKYIKDDKNVFYENEIVKGADPKTFKVVSGQKWDAEDNKFKYETGRRKE